MSGSALLDLFEDGEAVAVRQLVIEQDEIDAFRVRASAAARRVGLDDAVAFAVRRSVSDQRISCSSSTTSTVGVSMEWV